MSSVKSVGVGEGRGVTFSLARFACVCPLWELAQDTPHKLLQLRSHEKHNYGHINKIFNQKFNSPLFESHQDDMIAQIKHLMKLNQ
jgi:hypothetical protein